MALIDFTSPFAAFLRPPPAEMLEEKARAPTRRCANCTHNSTAEKLLFLLTNIPFFVQGWSQNPDIMVMGLLSTLQHAAQSWLGAESKVTQLLQVCDVVCCLSVMMMIALHQEVLQGLEFWLMSSLAFLMVQQNEDQQQIQIHGAWHLWSVFCLWLQVQQMDDKYFFPMLLEQCFA